MFSQLEEKICYVGREGLWAIPVENGNSGTGVNNRISKVNFRRREVEDWGYAESN